MRLHREGLPGDAIGNALGVSALTVYRWLKAGGLPAHDKPTQPRNIDPHVDFLARRWTEGCRNGARLWRELRTQGYRGGLRSVARWAQRQRRQEPTSAANEARCAAAWSAPSSRRCARLLNTAPEQLNATKRAFLDHLAALEPDLVGAGDLANSFAALLRDGCKDADVAGTALDRWIDGARGGLLDSLARGLQRDRAAVIAALTTPWSTSPVEGQITRLKAIKRSMYGRAGFHLLRQRVLLTA